MKQLILILVIFGILIGDAHAQNNKLKLVQSNNENETIDTHSCTRCIMLEQTWGRNKYTYGCPPELSAGEEPIEFSRQLINNWTVSESRLRFKEDGVYNTSFLSLEDIQSKICIYGDYLSITIDHIADLNNDGISEIVFYINSGGSCCPPSYHLIFSDKSGNLKLLEFQEQYDWDGSELLRENNGTVIALDDKSEGYGNTNLNRKTIFYGFNGKELFIKRRSELPYLQAIKEFHSTSIVILNVFEEESDIIEINSRYSELEVRMLELLQAIKELVSSDLVSIHRKEYKENADNFIYRVMGMSIYSPIGVAICY